MKKRVIAKEAQVSESAKIMNFKVQMPTNKGEMNRESMIYYVSINGSIDDKLWFIDLLDKTKKEKDNNVRKGEKYNGNDLYTLREEFCIHFSEFYQLSDEYKRKQYKDTYFADALASMMALCEDHKAKQSDNVIDLEMVS